MTIKQRMEYHNDPANWITVEKISIPVDFRIVRLRDTNIYKYQHYKLDYFEGWSDMGEYQLVNGNLSMIATKKMLESALKYYLS